MKDLKYAWKFLKRISETNLEGGLCMYEGVYVEKNVDC